MIRWSIIAGFKSIRRRPGLVFLLYAVSLALAALLAAPVFKVVDAGFGHSGFSPELAERFDVVLWADWLEVGGAGLVAAFRQFFWLIPLFVIVKVAAYAGLVHALKNYAEGSFWQGVGQYALPALGLALIFLPIALFAVGVLWVVISILLSDLGQVGTFWLAFVVGPLLTVAILAVIDLMHDYARIRLVTREEGVWKSFLGGSFWPMGRLSAILLYKFWFVAVAVLWLLPFWLDLEFSKTTVLGMIGAFAAQQFVILARQAVSVAWIGSEVSYFEERFVPPPDPPESPESPADVEEKASGAVTESDQVISTSEESPSEPH